MIFGFGRRKTKVRPRLVWSPAYTFDFGVHVFPVAKYRLIRERLEAERIAEPGDFEEPRPATVEELLTVHTEGYLQCLEDLTETPDQAVRRFEVPCTRQVLDAFRLAVGGTIQASRRALEMGGAANLSGGFHHAFADRGEGFCLLNDLAVAIRVLQAERAIRRAAVIDVDVHQGNGTARIFEGDETVFAFSIHQEHNYPEKEKSRLDIGLADGTEDDEYLAQLASALPAILDGHRPELVLYQGGADPFSRDQLGGLKLTKMGLRRRDERVFTECRRRRIPIAVTMGGGYAEDVEDVVDIHAATIEELGRALSG